MAVSARPLSLLLVEDNKDHVRIMTWVIESVDSRIRVDHAEDAETVIALLPRFTEPIQ